ncbi:MAG: lysophospholipid acyltransferase family protein [Proteobacteria bacterium]|nr:lysophospholipid acyltransferase family protein [Pseudomonadota bacterium]
MSGALGKLAAVLLRALGATWRVHFEGTHPLRSPETQPVLAAIWHRDVLIAAQLFRDHGIALPVSRSRDGDRATELIAALGYAPPARGSSSRGGTAVIRPLVRQLQRGVTVGIMIDGPRGPARRAKPGAVNLARLSGVPVTPLAIAARPCIRFRSWDGTLLPLPFAKVVCRFGPLLAVPADTGLDREAELIQELGDGMNRETDRADDLLGVARNEQPRS